MTQGTSQDKTPFITTSLLGSGHAAICLWWNPDGFWEPWQTGIGRYATQDEAVTEAKYWAEAEDLKYWEAGTHP